jgi:hypothetical protein
MMDCKCSREFLWNAYGKNRLSMQAAACKSNGDAKTMTVNFSPSPQQRLVLIVAASLSLLIFSVVLYRAQPSARGPILKPGQIPRFQAITLLEVNRKVLGDNDKITFGSPEFIDWDGDGQTDLILGYWASWGLAPGRGAGDGGKVRFFRNVGETDIPEYRDMGDLDCDKGPVRLKEA